MYKELLLGCGNSREKRIGRSGAVSWVNLTTLDVDPDTKPNVLHDLNVHPLPFADNSFDELHAYEVLEHIGKQGDWRAFFEEFTDYWRILKPNGILCATCPSRNSVWAWGDPGHVRIIQPETLIFLSQKAYELGIGKTPI